MTDRYIRFKVECPADVKLKKDKEVYRKLEYMGPVEGSKITKRYFRRSIKKPWERYLDSHEYISNRDAEESTEILEISDVMVLEDMTKDEYLRKYFDKLLI